MGTTYDLDADLSKLEAELAKGDRGFTAVAASADKAAAAVKKAGGEADKAGESAGKAGESWADLAAGMGGIVETGKAVLETITGVVGGAIELARSVADASEELKGFVSEDDLARIEGLGDSFDAADTAALTLKASIVTELEPALQGAIDAFIGATTRAREFTDSMSEVVDGEGSEAPGFFERLANTISASGTAGAFTVGTLRLLSGGYQLLAAEGKEAREEIEKITAAQEEQTEKVDKATSKKTATVKAAAKEETATVTDELDKQQEAREAHLASIREGVLAWQAEQAELFEAETEALAERLEAETEAWTAEWEARKAATQEATLAIIGSYTSFAETLSGLVLDSHQEQLDSISERRAAIRDELKDAEGAEKDKLRAQLDSLNTYEAAAKKQARTAFGVSQGAAIANVIASSAAAFAAMLVTFAALGPGAPIAAGAVVAPATAAQLATISQNKPPAHSGATLGADELYLGSRLVRQGEQAVIFNQRAVEQGAPAAAMAANRGVTPAPASYVVAIDGRVLGEALVRDSRRPGSPFGTPPHGFVDPYGRRGRR